MWQQQVDLNHLASQDEANYKKEKALEKKFK
jgi:hypothetical protein